MPPSFEYRPATWRTAGAGHRPWRAAVVKLSNRIDVQWLEPTPIENARDGDLTVSRAGTLDAAIVTPPTGEAFVVVSMYALWEKPHPTTSSSWIYADGSVHRLISDISVFVGQQLGHRILAAGDLNILHGYGDHGSGYWASRYTTVFDRMRVLAPFAVGDVTYPLARKGAYATEQVAGAMSGRNLLHRNVLTSQHQQRTAQAPDATYHFRFPTRDRARMLRFRCRVPAESSAS